jgi:hypothetical protein
LGHWGCYQGDVGGVILAAEYVHVHDAGRPLPRMGHGYVEHGGVLLGQAGLGRLRRQGTVGPAHPQAQAVG